MWYLYYCIRFLQVEFTHAFAFRKTGASLDVLHDLFESLQQHKHIMTIIWGC